MARVHGIRAEHHVSALGIGEANPRLSWKVSEVERNYEQHAYEVAATIEGVTQSAHVPSREQVLVPWPFEALTSRQSASVRVRVHDGLNWSPWSEPFLLETGILDPALWTAKFISPKTIGRVEDGAPRFSTSILIDGVIASARLYTTAYGAYRVELNGRRVGDDVLAPGWTSFLRRIKYQTHDVTDLLQSGPNRLNALVGNGWFRGQLVWPENRSSYGSRLGFLAQLHVTFADGVERIWGTDSSWTAHNSELRYDDLYDGETWDMRGECPSGREEHNSVEEIPADLTTLLAAAGPPLRELQVLEPVAVIRSPSGALIVDFGQNIAGRVRLMAHGPRGTRVTVRHAEVLESGELGIRPLRFAKATCSYVLSGEPGEVLEPLFTYSGFRYAEVSGLDKADLELAQGVVLGSDMERTGWFHCSNSEINQLHSNIVWSMRANFFDIPTDCPQRDERLGWTGDAQVFAPTANFLYDTAGVLTDWVHNLAVDQLADGTVPLVVPDVLRDKRPIAGWGDAATVVPTTLFHSFGDRQVLIDQYSSMKAWVEKVIAVAGPGRLWNTGYQLGDWLDPSAPPDHADQVKADPSVVATAYFARSARLLADAARELGFIEDALRYSDLALEVREAFNDAYVDGAGIVSSDCQTVYAMAICWDLLGGDDRLKAGGRLASLVREDDCRIGTGFLGTPLILDALCLAGHSALAFLMLTQHACPSWLYPVTMGATTVWERWDSMLPDGSINPGTMTSFNHYAYGAVADWIHRRVGGIAPGEPGYRTVLISPQPDASITSAQAELECPYGRISVSWSWSDDIFQLELHTPPGVTAVVTLPGTTARTSVGVGIHSFSTHLKADYLNSNPLA